MGKIKFTLADEANQKIRSLAAFDYGYVETLDPTRDFLTVGTPKDTRMNVKFDVSENAPK